MRFLPFKRVTCSGLRIMDQFQYITEGVVVTITLPSCLTLLLYHYVGSSIQFIDKNNCFNLVLDKNWKLPSVTGGGGCSMCSTRWRCWNYEHPVGPQGLWSQGLGLREVGPRGGGNRIFIIPTKCSTMPSGGAQWTSLQRDVEALYVGSFQFFIQYSYSIILTSVIVELLFSCSALHLS